MVGVNPTPHTKGGGGKMWMEDVLSWMTSINGRLPFMEDDL